MIVGEGLGEGGADGAVRYRRGLVALAGRDRDEKLATFAKRAL